MNQLTEETTMEDNQAMEQTEPIINENNEETEQVHPVVEKIEQTVLEPVIHKSITDEVVYPVIEEIQDRAPSVEQQIEPTTTTPQSSVEVPVAKPKKKRGWFYWVKRDDLDNDSDSDFSEDEDDIYAARWVKKDWKQMNVLEKSLTTAEWLGGNIAYYLGIMDSKFEVEMGHSHLSRVSFFIYYCFDEFRLAITNVKIIDGTIDRFTKKSRKHQSRKLKHINYYCCCCICCCIMDCCLAWIMY